MNHLRQLGGLNPNLWTCIDFGIVWLIHRKWSQPWIEVQIHKDEPKWFSSFQQKLPPCLKGALNPSPEYQHLLNIATWLPLAAKHVVFMAAPRSWHKSKPSKTSWSDWKTPRGRGLDPRNCTLNFDLDKSRSIFDMVLLLFSHKNHHLGIMWLKQIHCILNRSAVFWIMMFIVFFPTCKNHSPFVFQAERLTTQRSSLCAQELHQCHRQLQQCRLENEMLRNG